MENELIALFVGILLGLSVGIVGSKEITVNEIEKKCLYGDRLEFSGQLFSCQWLEGVTESGTPYERKPHPLKEGLK